MLRPPALAALALILAPTHAHAQIHAVVDGVAQDVPAATVRIVTTVNGRTRIEDRAWSGDTVPGLASITTTETTDEDGRGRVVSRTVVTRIEPQQVAYAAPVRVTVTQTPWQAPQAQQAYAQPPRVDEPDLAADGTPDGPLKIMRIHRDSWGGHFVAPVVINGVRLRAIIDTGAAYTILSPEDARRSGADRQVVREEAAVGIGGMTSVGVARLSSMSIGGQQLGRIVARIGQPGIPYTLLGQTEIAKLGSITITDGVMTIVPRGLQPQLAMR